MYRVMLYVNSFLALFETLLVPFLLALMSIPMLKTYPVLLVYLSGLFFLWVLILNRAYSIIKWDGLDSTDLLQLLVKFIVGSTAGFYALAFLVYPTDMIMMTIVALAAFALIGFKTAKHILEQDIKQANERQRQTEN